MVCIIKLIYIQHKRGIEVSNRHFNKLKIIEHLIARMRQKSFIKKMFEDLKFYFRNIILKELLYVGISLVKFFHPGF